MGDNESSSLFPAHTQTHRPHNHNSPHSRYGTRDASDGPTLAHHRLGSSLHLGSHLRLCNSIFFFFSSGICFNYSTKIEKEKREHAKQHGMIRTEITGAEIAEEMEKERRLFQLQMCEVRTDLPNPGRSPCQSADTRFDAWRRDCFLRILISLFLQALWDPPLPCCLIF